MNKKLNTFLFIVSATIFNILCVVISFLLLTVLFEKFIMPMMPEQGGAWGFSLIFIISLALSFVIYRFVIKFMVKKIDLEKYFDPIFVKRNIRKD